MSPFAESTLAVASRRLDNALAMLEEHADGGRPSLVGEAYMELLKLRGEIHSAAIIERIADVIGKAPTERPSGLRLVKP